MNKNNKIFVPLTLDNSTKSRFSGKQLLGFFIFFVVYLLFQVLVIKLRNDVLFTSNFKTPITVVIEVVGTYFVIFLIRKIVIRENTILNNYQTNKNLQKTELDFMWDIFSVKGSHIRYCSSGKEAVVVRLVHGYLLDRPSNQEQIHREVLNNALGVLSKQGYSHIYFNREVRDPNLEPLRETQQKIIKYKDAPVFELANRILQHTFNVCEYTANTEQEYYVIFADNMDSIKKLDHAANEFINALRSGVYVRMNILSDSEIWDFICSLYGLKFIDKSKLLNKMFGDNNIQLVQILEVNRASTNIAKKQAAEKIQQVKADVDVSDEAFNKDNDSEDYL